LTVADRMLKLQNLRTFEPRVQTLYVASYWKATIHIYSLKKKFQKIQQKFIAFIVAYPKTQKTVFFFFLIQEEVYSNAKKTSQ
jgi:hypothetical protein